APQHVGGAGEGLTRLDEGGAEVDGGSGAPLAGSARLLRAGEDAREEQDRGRQPRPLDLLQERGEGPVPSQDACDRRQPGDVATGAKQTALPSQMRQAEWRAAIPPEGLR